MPRTDRPFPIQGAEPNGAPPWQPAKSRRLPSLTGRHTYGLLVKSTIALYISLISIGCAELLATQPENEKVASFGHCWSDGKKFAEVIDDEGQNLAVAPVRPPYSQETGNVMCGVERGKSVPVDLPTTDAGGYATSGKGFLLSNGEPVYILAPYAHQRFWIVSPGQWFYD